MILAHAGDWLVDFIYVVPVLIVSLWISIKSLVDRRRDRADEDTFEKGAT